MGLLDKVTILAPEEIVCYGKKCGVSRGPECGHLDSKRGQCHRNVPGLPPNAPWVRLRLNRTEWLRSPACLAAEAHAKGEGDDEQDS